jgi:hypothetical protein
MWAELTYYSPELSIKRYREYKRKAEKAGMFVLVIPEAEPVGLKVSVVLDSYDKTNFAEALRQFSERFGIPANAEGDEPAMAIANEILEQKRKSIYLNADYAR